MRTNLHTDANSGSQNGSCGENKEKQERKRQTNNALLSRHLHTHITNTHCMIKGNAESSTLFSGTRESKAEDN